MNRFLAILTLVIFSSAAYADDAFLTWPEAAHDPAIPTIETAIGHSPANRLTRPEEAVRYLEALAAAAPDRMKLYRYGKTWEGRELVYAVISAPENIARLDQIQAGIQALADPRTTESDEAERLIADLPGTVWLSYAVHGNEISSTDAAMMTAYHLLAAQEDRSRKILDETLVFIDPLQNPDGRARFIASFEQALGIEPQADRQTAEHDEPWPGGRTNHYLFDLNRDWFRISQPETKGRIPALRKWLPLVLVDAHEMGGDQTYFFAPEAVPYNPHLTQAQKDNLHLFGRNHARYFDQFGIDYFTRDIFDAFYPGYGASWPSYYGGIAMTYEQASARGLVFRRYDGSELTYADGVRNHFITSVSTAEVVADNREKLWRDFYDYRRSAITEGRQGDTRSYILPAQTNQAGADELARLLSVQGVEVDRARESFRACRTDYDAGSYVIDLAQPEKRRISVLMERSVEMSTEFLEEQARRREKGLPDDIYDVTAWSLPWLFNVEADRCGDSVSVASERVSGSGIPAGSVENPDATVAFVVPWGEATSAKLLAAALRHGLAVKSADAAFTVADRRFPSGSLVFERGANPDDLAETLASLATETGATVVGLDTSWVTDGPSFGSVDTLVHPAPRIAMAWDEPTSSYNAGNTRFVLEGRYGYPVAPIRTSSLARADLDGYDVLILPAQGFGGGDYRGVLGKGGIEAVKDWVRKGGILISLGSAADFLAHPDVDLVSIRREDALRAEDLPTLPEPAEDASTVPGIVIETDEELRARIEPEKQSPESMPGAILRAQVDPDHWLGAGLKPEQFVLKRGNTIYTPAPLDEGTNVVRYAAADSVLASGYLWDAARRQIAHKPLAVAEPTGRGQVIAITAETTTRAYQDGLDLLLINAVFRGAQHASPLP